MSLVLDTSVVLAAAHRKDRHHHRCRALIDEAEEQLVLPSPTLCEIDYWLRKRVGAGAMLAILDSIEDGAVVVADLVDEDYERVHEILDRYEQVGFVDASVLAICERLGEPKLATLDRRHFSMVRPRHVDALELLP